MTKKHITPEAHEYLSKLPLYVGGRATLDGQAQVYKLSANENPFGASPRALAAYRDVTSLAQYPVGNTAELYAALAVQHKINQAQIVCGAGSDEILRLLAQCYLRPGTEAIYTTHGFLVYQIAIRAAGATPVIASERSFTTNVDTILAAVTPSTKMVFLANPNNPTGTMLARDEVVQLHTNLRNDIILVIDMAYAEYVSPPHNFDGFDLVGQADNIVITRSFSKAYGLAALRLGWGYCPPAMATLLERVRLPFNVNTPAAHAGIAALEDQEHITRTYDHNIRWRTWVAQQLDANHIKTIPSMANFVLMLFDDSETALAAKQFCWSRGVIPRELNAYNIPHGLRLTIGSETANRTAITALADFMEHRQ